MKLTHAYLCHSCQEIFERAPQGRCPACASHAISSLAWQVMPTAERESWLRRIRGGRSVGRFLPAGATKPALPYPCPTSANTLEAEAV
jgi:hypothetical protein